MKQKGSVEKIAKKSPDIDEVDLHIEEIVENHAGGIAF
jgi:hypothetical protein